MRQPAQAIGVCLSRGDQMFHGLRSVSNLAKQVFQVHGVNAEGMVVLRRRLRRSEVVKFFSTLPGCLIGIEACATAHHWARELSRLGHEVALSIAASFAPRTQAACFRLGQRHQRPARRRSSGQGDPRRPRRRTAARHSDRDQGPGGDRGRGCDGRNCGLAQPNPAAHGDAYAQAHGGRHIFVQPHQQARHKVDAVDRQRRGSDSRQPAKGPASCRGPHRARSASRPHAGRRVALARCARHRSCAAPCRVAAGDRLCARGRAPPPCEAGE